jgi:hypothetical protein
VWIKEQVAWQNDGLINWEMSKIMMEIILKIICISTFEEAVHLGILSRPKLWKKGTSNITERNKYSVK